MSLPVHSCNPFNAVAICRLLLLFVEVEAIIIMLWRVYVSAAVFIRSVELWAVFCVCVCVWQSITVRKTIHRHLRCMCVRVVICIKDRPTFIGVSAQNLM